ncbi:hypothetical protein D3C81_769060 [compost metagenome]
MTTRCLICDSIVVIHQDVVQAIALLIGATNGFLRGISNARPHTSHSPADSPENPLISIFYLLVHGVVGATSGCIDSAAFSQAVKKYHFSGYDYLCLRCGARHDEQVHT